MRISVAIEVERFVDTDGDVRAVPGLVHGRLLYGDRLRYEADYDSSAMCGVSLIGMIPDVKDSSKITCEACKLELVRRVLLREEAG